MYQYAVFFSGFTGRLQNALEIFQRWIDTSFISKSNVSTDHLQVCEFD